MAKMVLPLLFTLVIFSTFSIPFSYMSLPSQAQSIESSISSDLEVQANRTTVSNSNTTEEKSNATSKPSFVGTVDVRNLAEPEPYGNEYIQYLRFGKYAQA